MFQSFLLPRNRQPMEEANQDQNTKNNQKNQLPQITKYLQNEIKNISFQKEQERRKSLQQQSNQIEEEFQNKLFLQQRVNKKERDLFPGLNNSLFLGIIDAKPKINFNSPSTYVNQYNKIDSKYINSEDKDETSNRKRSRTLNNKNKQQSPSYLQEQEIPISQQKNMIQCNQVLDFKISIDQQQYDNQQKKKIGKSIPNYINFLQSRFEQPYQAAKEEFEKLQKSQNIFKQWGLIILFIFRLIKVMRLKKIKKIQNFKDLKIRLESCNLQEFEEAKTNWYEKLMKKILQTISQSKFTQNFKQNQNPNRQQFIQIRKQWMINLTLLFFQNLNEMTKTKNFNQKILEQAQLHIFQINKKGSLFAGKRIKTKLIIQEQTLLICDYFFFQLIIEEIIQSSNKLLSINEHHLAECKFQLVSICSLIQILFMKHFKDMETYQPKISKIIQKRLNISKNKNQELIIIEDDDIDQNEIIIVGLNTEEFYEKLIKENQKWYEDISILFRNCVSNLSSQNNI